MEAHSKILLPLSSYLAAVVDGGVEVVIMDGKLPTPTKLTFIFS